MRVSNLMIGAGLCLAASSATAESAAISRYWQSAECGVELRLDDGGGAMFVWDGTPIAATWKRTGEKLILDLRDDLHEFDGRFTADERIVGTHIWTDVAGMIGERPCVLVPKVP